MRYTATELAAAWQAAQDSHVQARRIAADFKGDTDAYPSMRIAAAEARDNYTKWSEVFGYDAVSDEIRDLGRQVRMFLNSLPDEDIYELAVTYGFPGPVVQEVSADSLRWWLDTAWADDNPRKTHVMEEAIRRGVERAAQDPTAVKARLMVVFSAR